MKRIIEFKSIPLYFDKEKTDRKNNTVRQWEDNDWRFDLLDEFISGVEIEMDIMVVNTQTNEKFIRHIQDVTEWNGLYIITWKPQTSPNGAP